MRANSCAISFGRSTKSTHPVSIALIGMLGKRADPGYWANVMPPACLIARMPGARSEPPPERITPIEFLPNSCASEMNRASAEQSTPPLAAGVTQMRPPVIVGLAFGGIT
jgi:hypothetical protein